MKKQADTKPEGPFAKHKKFYIIYMAALVVITVGLNIAARRSTAFAEWYSTHIYKVLVATVGMLVGLVPFSMYELLIILGIILLIFILCRTVFLIIKKRGRAIFSMYAGVLALLFTVVTLFTVNCGVFL